MADLKKYRINKKLSPYSHLKLVFNTDGGLVETDDEWYDDQFFKEVTSMFPKGVGADDDMPGWYDKPELHVVYHGWNDVFTREDEDTPGLAFVAVYFDLKSGTVKRIETEDAEM